jgi:hypothetical protein
MPLTQRKRQRKPKIHTDGLPHPAARNVPETFRVTFAEHEKMVTDAIANGYRSMSSFFRSKMGLDN